MAKKQHRFFNFAQGFDSDLNIYVFICNECCNQIITQSGKIKLVASREGKSLPKKVVTDVLAQALGFSGVNFCLGFGRHL